jgi:hypothetical protein
MNNSKYEISNQLLNHAHYKDNINTQYLTTSTLQIYAEDNSEGDETINFMAHKQIWQSDNITLSLTGAGVNSGFIGGHLKTNSKYLLIWAIFNGTMTALKGFGLTNLPYETATTLSGTAKGAISTITLPNGNNFTLGARVSIRTSDTDWNIGTVISKTATTINVILDNGSYGTALIGTTPVVIQYNKYKPYNLYDGSLVSPFYKLISNQEFYVNSSGNLQIVDKVNIGYKIVGAWDKNLTTIAGVIGLNYQLCSGYYCINPLSQLLGTVIRNLNGDAGGANSPSVMTTKEQCYLRGGATSGTGQYDQFESHKHTQLQSGTAGGATAGNFSRGDLAGVADGSFINLPKTDGTYALRTGSDTHPINVTMVFVMGLL